MRRAIALTGISFLISLAVPFFAAPASAAWICEAESASNSGTATGASKKEAQDRALGDCASRSQRFSTCRIVTCHRGR